MACVVAENSSYAEMWETFSALREKNLLCDLKIVSKDGRSFPAHTAVIAANSRHFHMKLTALPATDNTENHCTAKHQTLTLDVTHCTLAIVLDYMYTRRPSLTTANVCSVIQAAVRYELESLVVHCVNYIQLILSANNCVSFLELSNDIHMPDLRMICMRFISKNFRDISSGVTAGSQFHELGGNDLLELMACDNLNVYSEEELFEAAVAWIDHSPEARASFIPHFLHRIRMGLVDMEYFFEKISSNAFVQKHEAQCQQVLQEAWQLLFQAESEDELKIERANVMLRPRTPHSVLLVVGGWSTGSPTASIEAYDPRAEKWFTQPQIEESSPRSYHGLVTLKGQVYMMGGFDGTSYFNTMRRFDPVTKVWQDVAPMYSRRCYVSVCASDDLIYACGGFDGHNRLDSVECYDPKTNQWTMLPPMNMKRSDASAAFIDGCVYMIGGFNGEQCLNTVEKYNPKTAKWTYTQGMRSPRSGVTVVTHDKHIYALGGFDGEHRLRTAERFSPSTLRWTEVGEMNVPRSNFAAAVLEGRVHVMGGFNGTTTIREVEYLDMELNQWVIAPDMNVNRSAVRACVISDIPNSASYTFHCDEVSPSVNCNI